MQVATASQVTPRVLLVDLNNFARYPSMAIGYIAASLRGSGMRVDVFAPLMVGVQGVVREVRPRPWSLAAAKVNHWVATSSSTSVRQWRNQVAARQNSGIRRHEDEVIAGFASELARSKPDVVLISTYLMYRRVCEAIARLANAGGTKVLLGGPYFAHEATVSDWAVIQGVTAVAAGEMDDQLPAVIEAMAQGGDLCQFPGIVAADVKRTAVIQIAPPQLELDRLPFPDYSDYPWHLYPNRIVPVITGRGCAWGECTFCSDVTSTAGRTYRSRSPENVLEEIRHHNRSHQAQRFVFTDLKLNSNVQMWRSLHAGMQAAAPGAQWIGAIHVGPEPDNGLTEKDLRAAAESGCVRLTTGLETGSQRMATLMRKGTKLDRISKYLHDAATAGISCRCTMVIGHPGELADDVEASASFLADHKDVIERVTINRLQVTAGTALHALMRDKTERFKGVRIISENPGMAQVEHEYDVTTRSAHRRAVAKLLTAAHRINAKDLSERAREFEGVM
jgi:anaerobic magnesium-protoporphyrin IX monomethyl ester cyclase